MKSAALTVLIAAVVLSYSAAAAVGDITTVAGNGGVGAQTDNVAATASTVLNPAGLACDSAGNLFICDSGHHTVRRVNVTTGIITTVAGTGVAGSAGDSGAAILAQLNQPTGVLVDRAGNIYIAEFNGHRVRRIDALTGLITTVAGNGTASTSGDGGPAVGAGVRGPTSLHMNAAGDLFIAQNGGGTENRVRRVTGTTISTVAGGGVAVPANGVAASAVSIQFQQGGNYIHVDLAGNLFIADELLNLVYRVSPAGIITLVGGNTTSGFSGDGGAATAAAIDDPTSIGVDLTGTIFVSNSAGQSRIRRIDGGSGIISSIAGTGTNGFSGDGGPGTAAQIATTTGFGGVCVDNFGNVFFSDFNNNRVRRLQGVAFATPPPGPLPTFLATGSVGAPFVYNLPSSGPFSPTPTGLPPGLSLAGGVVSGTPTLDGTFSVTFTSGSTNFVVVFLISPSGVSTGPGQNGGGPNPIPRFITLPNGGTSPVTVIFNPAASYLPVSSTPNQVNYYQAIYDFGDGTPNLVIGPPLINVGAAAPASNASVILSPITHVYLGDQLYNVTLTINVFVASIDAANVVVEGPLTGPSGVNTGVVRLAQVNFAPGPLIQNNGSQANGEVPFTLTVTPSFGFDEDGYIVWAAIDWGDGTAELIRNPPTLPTVPTNHVYAVSGIYKVTVSVIDNGRLPLGTVLPSLPDPRDPIAALAFFRNFQASLPLSTFGPQFFNIAVNPRAPLALDPKFDPTLRQDFLLVQVTDNMVGIKGKFTLDFARTQRDSLDLTVKSNVQLDKVAGETVVVTVGVGTTAVTQTFVADRRGRFRGADGFTFAYDARKQLIRVKFTKAQLATALGVANATVANGNTDVRLTIRVGTRTLSTTLRFSYVSDQGSKAKGKGGISKDAGN